ncbi:MAG: acyl-CoA thioesterase [Spirochaetes bacterium]|nr:acyl-CoA thioesterase [Spirochaetota bacterium]
MSTVEIRIKGYHLDLFGRVSNQRFLDFLEDARWSYLDSIGLNYDEFAKRGVFLAVVNINVNFRAPSFLGDVLIIETEVDRIGNRSITVKQKMYNKKNEQIILDAEVVYVIVDLATGKSIPIDNEMRQQWLELSNKKNTH